jgi:hypothetical protein
MSPHRPDQPLAGFARRGFDLPVRGVCAIDGLARLAADAEREAAWALSEDLDELLADVHTFAQFKAVENQLLDEVAELESGESRMSGHVNDVAGTMKAIADATRAGAARLLASIGIKVDVPTDNSKLASRLRSARAPKHKPPLKSSGNATPPLPRAPNGEFAPADAAASVQL